MWAYRALLRLLPASFRAEYGDEMTAVVAARRREAAGPLGRAAAGAAAILDVFSTSARVHADILRQDLHFAARSLRRTPAFSLTVVGVAALGIGATTATFTVTDHVLMRPLPFQEPERLVKLWQDQSARGCSRVELSPANYRDWKRMATSFTRMGAYRTTSVNLLGDGEPERLDGAAVTADLLPLLGVRPLLGRVFHDADDQEGAPGTVLLGHSLWRARYGGDPTVVGRTLRLDGEPHVVIGVMPAHFHFPTRDVEVWTPMRFDEAAYEDRGNLFLRVVARLRPGAAREEAEAEMDVVAARLERAYPDANAHTGATVVALDDEVPDQGRLLLFALLGAGACVLLVAATNLAGLLLARGVARRQEMAVRAALGAGRERLVRQLLTESLALAAVGGVCGVALAAAATPLVSRLVPNALPIPAVPAMDLRVLGFAAAVTLLTGLAFGVLPARWGLGDASTGMREGARSGVGGRREAFRTVLVVAEVTLSVVLLVTCGLLLRALLRVRDVDPGFRTEGVLTLRTALPFPKYAATARRTSFYDQVLDGVRTLPGVTGAGYISFLPMTMRGGIWPVEIEGRPAERGREETISLRFATPGLFAALGIPVRAGRDLAPSDTLEAPAVAVVSASFASRSWPGQDPLGRRFRLAEEDFTVAGVVGDVRVRGLERPSEPQVYLSPRQVPNGAMSFYVPKDLVVHTDGDPALLAPAVRRILAEADPQQPVSDVRLLSEVVALDTAPRAVQVRVLSAFAGTAVLLAAIGIHGLLAFAVQSRTQEIGVRMALGARRADILGMVLRSGVLLSAAGVAAGLAAAYAAGRALESILFGVSPRDLATFAAAGAVALAAALLGSLPPALRAARVDPLDAMRAE